MTCQDLDARVVAYLAGELSRTDAELLEQHAAECAACEVALDLATQRTPITNVLMPPMALRQATLAAVAARRARTSSRRQWVGAALLGAAAGVVFWIVPQRPTRPESATVMSGIDTSARTDSTPERLAATRARPEFEALDSAAQELQRAIEASPGDPQLRAFLASVTSQRSELQRCVQAAKS